MRGKAHSSSETISPHVSSRQVHSNRIVFFDRGQGPALLLLHGMFGDYLDWEPVLEPLSKRHRVIAVDLPGFGNSDKPRQEYTSDFFVATLHDLLGQLQTERATLVGNSFGGEIAVFYALRYPQEVERLILVSSGGFSKLTEPGRQLTLPRLDEAAIAAFTPEIQEPMFARIFAKSSEQQRRYVQKQNEKLKRPDYPAYAQALASSIRLAMSIYLLDQLPEIRCPTLLLWGGADPIFPVDEARRALERLPRGELIVLDGCGHAPQLDCPEAFVQAIEAFLQSSPR